MPSDPLCLAFDTSAAHCAAALLSGTNLLNCRAELMGRGQAERLMPLLEEILSDAGKTWSDLDVIGVGTGPGNFTGIRISVSAARGLALGLGIPAMGVPIFDAIADPESDVTPVIPGPRGRAYVRRPGQHPELLDEDTAGAIVNAARPGDATELAKAIARRAQIDLLALDGTVPPAPAPLYVKPADAAPSREKPPVILA